ncbi:MAG: GHKL domain-containing protein [Oscillospiraceae bacterium]|jgi:hypothetical protein|nr:GHKL domain-containing protein [Oscillospiraceae bacterium]
MNITTILSSIFELHFLYDFILYFCFALLCYVPFLDKITRPKHRIIIELAVLCVIYLLPWNILYTYVYAMDGIWEWEYFILFNRISGFIKDWLFFILTFLIVRKNVSVNVWKLAFVVLLAINWLCIQASLYVFSSRLVFYLLIEFFLFVELSTILMVDMIVQIILILILFLVFLWVFYRFVKPHLDLSDSNVIKKLCVIPVMFYIFYEVNLEISLHYDASAVMQSFTFSLIFVFAITSIYFYVTLFRMYHNITKTKKIEQQLKMQDEHYTALQAYVADARRMRHDMRQHLSVFQSYISTGKTEKLIEYIDEYRKSIPEDVEIAYCENNAVNAILCHNINKAKRDGIKIDVKTELPEKCGIQDIDLCIVYGNSLENAIEATNKLSEGKFIKIRSRITGNLLTIIVENTFDGIIKRDGDTLLSLKNDGEGIGTPSIKAIAKKYGGSAQFSTNDNVFRTTVILRLSDY